MKSTLFKTYDNSMIILFFPLLFCSRCILAGSRVNGAGEYRFFFKDFYILKVQDIFLTVYRQLHCGTYLLSYILCSCCLNKQEGKMKSKLI